MRYAFLLLPIWWAWHGFAMYVTRFDADDGVQRALTFLQMVAVIFMAANAEDGLASDSAAGFAAAYAVMRLMLGAQYLRATRLRQARAVARESAIGLMITAAVWLFSAFTPAPARFVVWGLAVAIEIGHRQPWPSTHPRAAAGPRSPARALRSLHADSARRIDRVADEGDSGATGLVRGRGLSALLGIGLIFTIWYGYFEGAHAAAERHVRSAHDARLFAIWHQAHIPLYLGLILTAIGIEHVVKAGGRLPLNMAPSGSCAARSTSLLGALTVLVVAAPVNTASTSCITLWRGLLLSTAPLAPGAASSALPAVLVVAALAAIAALHAGLVLRERVVHHFVAS